MSYRGTTNMRSLRTYIHALSHYESVKPFRGSDVRPLESRRKKHMTIRLNSDKDVIIRQHNTDVLTYKADDTILINNGGWSSMTTHELLSVVSPLYCAGHQNQTWVQSYFDTPTGERKHGYLLLRDNTPEVFKNEGENLWLRVNPLFPTVGVINREAAKRVRAQYAAFKAYGTGLLKLMGKDIKIDPQVFVNELGTIRWTTFKNMYSDMRYLMLSTDTEDNFKAFLHLINPYTAHAKEFTKNFDELMLLLHADEMVTTKEVYTGGLVTNKYKRYTRYTE